MITKLGLFIGAFIMSTSCATSSETPKLDIEKGFLACSSKPNCVVSDCEKSDSHYIEPIKSDLNPDIAMDKIASILSEYPKTKIIEKNKNYLRSEFRSAIFGFVDDVEFYKKSEKAPIHVKSASRIGYSDLGVNRKRVEKIRASFFAERGK